MEILVEDLDSHDVGLRRAPDPPIIRIPAAAGNGGGDLGPVVVVVVCLGLAIHEVLEGHNAGAQVLVRRHAAVDDRHGHTLAEDLLLAQPVDAQVLQLGVHEGQRGKGGLQTRDRHLAVLGHAERAGHSPEVRHEAHGLCGRVHLDGDAVDEGQIVHHAGAGLVGEHLLQLLPLLGAGSRDDVPVPVRDCIHGCALLPWGESLPVRRGSLALIDPPPASLPEGSGRGAGQLQDRYAR